MSNKLWSYRMFCINCYVTRFHLNFSLFIIRPLNWPSFPLSTLSRGKCPHQPPMRNRFGHHSGSSWTGWEDWDLWLAVRREVVSVINCTLFIHIVVNSGVAPPGLEPGNLRLSVQHLRHYTKRLEPLDKVTRCCYSAVFLKSLLSEIIVSIIIWSIPHSHVGWGGRGLFALPLLCGLWHQSVILLYTVEGLIFIWFLLHWWICWCSCQRGFSGQHAVPGCCTL